MRNKLIRLLIVLWCGQGFPSVLGDLASAVPEHTFVKMPVNASLTGLNMSYAFLYWMDSATWNPFSKQLEWVGSGGTCCTNGDYFMVTYGESSDTWKIAATPYNRAGHGYDGNAVNLNNGDHYFGMFGDKQVKVWNGSVWSTLPDIPFSAATTPSLSWFSDINGGKGGLVFVGESPNAAWYDGVKWTAIPGGQWGSYNNFSEYSAVKKAVWLGAGNGGETVSYKLDANLKLTKLKNAPFSLNNSASLHSCDPVSGMFIVTNLNDQTWWEFDIASDTWTQITGLQGAPVLDQSELQAPISDHGVILYFRHYWAQRDVYLYRHATASAAESVPAARYGDMAVQVTPNPCGMAAKIRLASGGAAKVDIYDISGKHLESFAPSSHVTWNAAKLPAGIYIIKADANGRTQVKKVLVQK